MRLSVTVSVSVPAAATAPRRPASSALRSPFALLWSFAESAEFSHRSACGRAFLAGFAHDACRAGRFGTKARGARAVRRPAAPLRPRRRAAQLRAGPALAPGAGRGRRGAGPSERILDVATRHRAWSPRRSSAATGARVVGLDQSAADARRRAARLARRPGSPRASSSSQGEAERAAVRRRRVRRTSPSPTCCATSTTRPRRCASSRASCSPGGRIAIARVRRAAAAAAARPLWWLYTRVGLPALGRARRRASGTRSGASSGRASTASTRATRSPQLAELWRAAGIGAVAACGG